MKRILFVCHGNICRSPLAEGVLRHLAEQAGLGDEVQTDSAGVLGFHRGEVPDSRMRAVSQSHGVPLDGVGVARKIRASDFDDFDLIMAMDDSNYDGICRLASNDEERAQVRMFLIYDPEQDNHASVPDPFYGGHEGFEWVFEMVMRGCKRIIELYKAGTL